MNNRKCIHPRKVIKIMREFIDDISNFEFEETTLKLPNDFFNSNLPTDEWCKILREAEEITETYKRKCKIINLSKTGKSSYARVSDLDDEIDYFTIGINWNEDYGDKQFRADFITRCNLAKGFANITLTILHELGHFETHNIEFEDYDRDKELQFIRENYPPYLRNFAYFQLPDEQVATNWAIKWLDNKENRKKAKSFEKAFFSCFERAV